MPAYIALLRAINVGGHTVTMEKLRGHFRAMGMQRVGTYIQSGNVFFDSTEEDRLELQRKIENHLAEALGYPVPTCLRTVEELQFAVENSPFKGVDPPPDVRHLIVFAATAFPVPLTFPLVSPKGDYAIVGATPMEAFVEMHLLNGRPGNPIFIEKMLGIKATSRFYHTSIKILAAAMNR
jgi:uncharacterized protein (DUF1697 family)